MVIGDRCPYTWAADEVTWKSVSDSSLGMDGPDSRLVFYADPSQNRVRVRHGVHFASEEKKEVSPC